MQKESDECQGLLFLDQEVKQLQNNKKITKGQLTNFKWKRKTVETLLETREKMCAYEQIISPLCITCFLWPIQLIESLIIILPEDSILLMMLKTRIVQRENLILLIYC